MRSQRGEEKTPEHAAKKESCGGDGCRITHLRRQNRKAKFKPIKQTYTVIYNQLLNMSSTTTLKEHPNQHMFREWISATVALSDQHRGDQSHGEMDGCVHD